MTGSAWTLVVTFLVVAALDWAAVASGRRRLELVAKPLALLVLLTVALAPQPVDEVMRGWFVAALGLSLVGDVLLLGDRSGLFLGGLVAFLLAHVCYLVGFVVGGISRPVAAAALVLALVALAPLVSRLLRGVRAQDPGLVAPVAGYVLVIAAMLAAACGSGVLAAAVGAAAFLFSDLVIGWTRFVRAYGGARVVIMVTYHLGQLLLVLSLTTPR